LSYSREETISEFKKCYGKDAAFKEGQLEAVEAVLEAKRTLVVQKTGWGKSLVYFLATKMIRKKQNKFTLIISPLLVLMNNQIDSAAKLELDVRTINSENRSDWEKIIDEVARGNVDALIISPERLANEEFKQELSTRLASKIGLFVVDEAHCISDWGHDFRPDYRRIVDLVNLLPRNVPVLATTATANNRVVEDIKLQLGQDLVVSRGPLIRESIAIQTVQLDSREERLVWILNHINEMPGSGIVYCLTVNDCKLVNRWLKENGINSEAYYSNMETDEKILSLKNS
jgi:ATP-dependent DNA helicase RecQ